MEKPQDLSNQSTPELLRLSEEVTEARAWRIREEIVRRALTDPTIWFDVFDANDIDEENIVRGEN